MGKPCEKFKEKPGQPWNSTLAHCECGHRWIDHEESAGSDTNMPEVCIEHGREDCKPCREYDQQMDRLGELIEKNPVVGLRRFPEPREIAAEIAGNFSFGWGDPPPTTKEIDFVESAIRDAFAEGVLLLSMVITADTVAETNEVWRERRDAFVAQWRKPNV
jgi:hypothetical protein